MNKKVLENKIIYQIFPRSFYDANDDGDGDLQGIIKKIPYLANLGINAIWLCPIYSTKFVDAGYDVLDYKNVWKQFGTLADFKKLQKVAQKNGIDIIMDIVINHVSSDHVWFKKALESKNNKEHDYFIWRDNLSEEEKKAESLFGGSAWEYIPHLNRYYFHLFSKEQVDLNWNNPKMIDAMVDVVDFWYKLGVKGFRIDAIKHIAKDFKTLESNPAFAWCSGAVKFLKEFNKKAFGDKPDAYTFGEASSITADEVLKYASGKQKVADNYYNFAWWWIGWGKLGRNEYNPNWEIKAFADSQKPFQENLKIKPYMITNFLSNHDTSRSISRWGDTDFFFEESAKSHAMLLFMLKGIPCIYYGEEIGLLNTKFSDISEFRDCDSFNFYDKYVKQDKVFSDKEFLRNSNINSRDAGRSLMQWDNSINAGFNLGFETWFNLGSNQEKINAKDQIKDKNSIFNFYKKLIYLRKNELNSILIHGTSEINCDSKTNLITIKRVYKTKKLTVLINMTNREIKLNKLPQGSVILSTYNLENVVIDSKLRPYESIAILK